MAFGRFYSIYHYGYIVLQMGIKQRVL